jgi:glycosyltransferase involved in cell wall biosynthesis
MAIISHVHPSLSKGGAELSAYALYQALRRLDQDVIFIAAVPEARLSEVVLGSSREFAIPHDPSAYDHFYHIGGANTRDALLDVIRGTGVRIANFQHFMNIGVNALRAVAELPEVTTLLTLHEYLAICHNHGQMITRTNQTLCEMSSPRGCQRCYPDNSAQQFAMRKNHFLDAFVLVDGFISPSRFLARRYVEWGIPADRLTVIENGLDLVPEPAPQRRRRPGDRSWTFGYFGQITPFKGLSSLLDVADQIAGYEELPERIRLRIHGNMVGQSQEFLDRFAACVERHPFLSYVGPYENDDVRRLMAQCDYVVVPSIWWENSPVVIQEAYAVGRPVICSGIGGMAEKVADGVTGLHFTPNDPFDLLRALEIAADQQVFDELCKQLPPVTAGATMANAYLDAIARWSVSDDAAEAGKATAS